MDPIVGIWPEESATPPAEAVPTSTVAVVEKPPVGSPFTSLYYSQAGTLEAIGVGLLIVVAVQLIVARIFRVAKSIIEALTFFATSMVAFLVAIYLCDMLIAGPDVMLLHEGERSAIVNFVKDTCLMVFAYFFGTKSVSTPTGGADE
jgi:hypothetical protein